ncbi:MipA/OmpV family protein [Rhodophyticola porphyridii]|uniref:MipA/OmpV family protein n=1 Tax=Rhodophyticola porphyridii TaxID=1852017 RepID=A0A3L9Y3W8_9RHOB|nr:MipA/OmpV family protein [Rhodophyticola porphyridii]RMA43449.1 MipA/OmpV family protein [Rhodophyticola porphyridii]
MTRYLAGLALVLSVFATGTAVAQEQPQGLSFGLAAGVSNSLYVGDEDDTSVFPLLSYQGQGFSVGFDGLTVDMIDRGGMRVQGRLAPRFTALEDPDAAALQGLDRDITVDAGFSLAYDISPQATVNATFLQEITGEHDGRELTVDVRHQLMLGQLPLGLSAGLTWQSEDLAGYLYGVRPSEATGTRPAYRPDAAVIPFVGVSTAFPITDSAAIFATAQASFLDDTITDSPIVDEDRLYSANIGIQFNF